MARQSLGSPRMSGAGLQMISTEAEEAFESPTGLMMLMESDALQEMEFDEGQPGQMTPVQKRMSIALMDIGTGGHKDRLRTMELPKSPGGTPVNTGRRTSDGYACAVLLRAAALANFCSLAELRAACATF